MTANETVSLLRQHTPHVLAAIALVAMMVEIGAGLVPVTARAEKRRERRLVLRALVFNFVAVPLLAVGAARAVGATGPIALALLLLAASPGGRHAPALARAAGADVGLSVEITLFANKLNSFVSPLWVAWMTGTHRVSLHETTYIAELIALQVVPYFGARALRKRRPATAARIVRPARLVATFAAVALGAVLVAHHELRVALLVGMRGWAAALLFGGVLLGLGWLVGGRSATVRRSFAITAESRNLALAMVLASITLRDRQVMIAIFAAWLILLAFGGAAALLARTRRLPVGGPVAAARS